MEAQRNRAGRRLNVFCSFTAASTLFLIVAGGLVTSTGSGLAVPDWPLAYGMVFPPMVGGIFYEHGHRMVASFVGFLTVILAIWLWRSESRRWVRNLGFGALAAVIVQGLLGGLTVIFLLPTAVSVAHACLAQTFFCITVSLAVFTSPSWQVGPAPLAEWEAGIRLRLLSVLAFGAVFVQLILGALVRHTEAGLAIPDFPLSFGHLFPPFSQLVANPNAPFPIATSELRSRVLIHFLHRSWALVAASMVIWVALRVVRNHRDRSELLGPAALASALVLAQIVLGGYVVWTEKQVAVSTLHVVVGASILASILVVGLRAWRASAVGATSIESSPVEGAAT